MVLSKLECILRVSEVCTNTWVDDKQVKLTPTNKLDNVYSLKKVIILVKSYIEFFLSFFLLTRTAQERLTRIDV